MADISQILEEAEDCKRDIFISRLELERAGCLVCLRRQSTRGPLGGFVNFQVIEAILKVDNVVVDFGIAGLSFRCLGLIRNSAQWFQYLQGFSEDFNEVLVLLVGCLCCYIPRTLLSAELLVSYFINHGRLEGQLRPV